MNGVEKVFPMAETYVEGIADGNERIQAQIKRACCWSWRESKLKNAAGAGPRITASTVELQCPSRVFSASQLSFLAGRYIYGYRVRRCIMRLTRKSTMKMKKQILAISAAAKATNPNPRAPATNAIRRKTSV
jgi:hypothetical protein